SIVINKVDNGKRRYSSGLDHDEAGEIVLPVSYIGCQQAGCIDLAGAGTGDGGARGARWLTARRHDLFDAPGGIEVLDLLPFGMEAEKTLALAQSHRMGEYLADGLDRHAGRSEE